MPEPSLSWSATTTPSAAVAMGCGDPSITIPSLSIGQSNRNAISTALAAAQHGQRDAIERHRPSARTPTAGSSARTRLRSARIRDMWTPTCKGMPGKVSDASTTAPPTTRRRPPQLRRQEPRLLAAGRRRDYNGRTITGIGLTKAAAIYCRAHDRLPDPDHRLRRPRRRPEGSVRETWCASPSTN